MHIVQAGWRVTGSMMASAIAFFIDNSRFAGGRKRTAMSAAPRCGMRRLETSDAALTNRPRPLP